jgi:kumamolisin
MTIKRVAIKGSERKAMTGSRRLGAVDDHEPVRVTILLRRSPNATNISQFISEQAQRGAQERQFLTHEEFARTSGADPADIQAVEAFAKQSGLEVAEVHREQRRIVLSGPAKQMSAAFEVSLALFGHAEGQYRGREGEIHVPEKLAAIVEGVFGLDNRPQSHPHFRIHRDSEAAIRAKAVAKSFSPVDVAKLYDFPTDVTGAGQCIAIIELGGGYRLTELKKYFAQLDVKAPRITSVSVDGAHNQPTGNADGPDAEVDLDIEVAGAVAPGANIVVYFAPNTDAGFLDAITTAVHDTRNNPSVISISWGAAESAWTKQAMLAMDSAFQDAAALGVTICCASGDDGSGDRVNDGRAHVDFPASSPNVLACGGTRLEASGTTINKEVVWNEGANNGATGGGVSDTFALPDWQSKAKVPHSANPGKHVGRGVPDVSGDADPQTGYEVLVDGESFVIGGTSAVAPLWAGFIALANQKLDTRLGNLNPLIYALSSKSGAFHDIRSGNNGAYKADAGWDACTGLGTPNGQKLISALLAKQAH